MAFMPRVPRGRDAGMAPRSEADAGDLAFHPSQDGLISRSRQLLLRKGFLRGIRGPLKMMTEERIDR